MVYEKKTSTVIPHMHRDLILTNYITGFLVLVIMILITRSWNGLEQARETQAGLWDYRITGLSADENKPMINNPMVEDSVLLEQFSVQIPLGNRGYVRENAAIVPDEDQKLLSVSLLEGRMPQTRNEVALEQQTITRLPEEKKIGDSITLEMPDGAQQSFTITGILEDSSLLWDKEAGIPEMYFSNDWQAFSTPVWMVSAHPVYEKNFALASGDGSVLANENRIRSINWQDEDFLTYGILMVLVLSMSLFWDFGFLQGRLWKNRNRLQTMLEMGMSRKRMIRMFSASMAKYLLPPILLLFVIYFCTQSAAWLLCAISMSVNMVVMIILFSLYIHRDLQSVSRKKSVRKRRKKIKRMSVCGFVYNHMTYYWKALGIQSLRFGALAGAGCICLGLFLYSSRLDSALEQMPSFVFSTTNGNYIGMDSLLRLKNIVPSLQQLVQAPEVERSLWIEKRSATLSSSLREDQSMELTVLFVQAEGANPSNAQGKDDLRDLSVLEQGQGILVSLVDDQTREKSESEWKKNASEAAFEQYQEREEKRQNLYETVSEQDLKLSFEGSDQSEEIRVGKVVQAEADTQFPGWLQQITTSDLLILPAAHHSANWTDVLIWMKPGAPVSQISASLNHLASEAAIPEGKGGLYLCNLATQIALQEKEMKCFSEISLLGLVLLALAAMISLWQILKAQKDSTRHLYHSLKEASIGRPVIYKLSLQIILWKLILFSLTGLIICSALLQMVRLFFGWISQDLQLAILEQYESQLPDLMDCLRFSAAPVLLATFTVPCLWAVLSVIEVRKDLRENIE